MTSVTFLYVLHGTMVGPTSFDQSCHQVNLACLRGGVAGGGGGVDGGGIMEQFFSQSSITYLWCGVWCLFIQHQCTFYI